MQTSTWNSENAGSFASRTRGHMPHLSISDENHHVTETIGFLYGDDDERDPRRTSATSSNARSSLYSDKSNEEDMTSPHRTSFPRKRVPDRRAPDTRIDEVQDVRPALQTTRSHSFETNGNSQLPVTNITRDRSPSQTAQTQFPLNDIDYESSPAAVAQELSNLQALRRMSMDVNAAGDPDLPSLNVAAMPTAPSPTSSEDDAARMFWVPARLHPELAPKEFKTFLESKAEQIKRRSSDASSFTSSPMSTGSVFFNFDEGSLRRKRSMLSREINNSTGYEDGAERLERKRSESHAQQPSDPNLAELELLVGTNLQQQQRPTTPDDDTDFVLPAGATSGLKRSRKTTYNRRGGDRPQRTRRGQTLEQEGTSDSILPVPDVPPLPASQSSTNSAFSAPSSDYKSSNPDSPSLTSTPQRASSPPKQSGRESQEPVPSEARPGGFRSVDRRNTSNAMEAQSSRKPMTATERQYVPRIVESPPKEESSIRRVAPSQSATDIQPSQAQPQPQSQSPAAAQSGRPRHPERISSRENLAKAASGTGRPSMSRTHASASGISMKTSRAEVPPPSTPTQNLEQPFPLPGQDTNTSNLSIIPTLTIDKQSQEKKESKKSSWSWGSLLGKDEEREKAKGKGGRNSQIHDNTRLDVLQTSIEGSSRRRETIELDRESLKLDEERKKESQRKAPPGDKKEKRGFMSSLFSREHKTEKESKKSIRGLSPEVPYRELRADIDYSWTRFSILEERAIYRMAHIKLANPRRALYSQVLLSNFMYSYLAKVQQMHPQMNLPTSAKQQKRQKEQQQHQPEEFSTYQRYQQQQEKQQTTQPPPHQQQAPTQVYEGEFSSNGYEEQPSRSSTRGSTHSTGSNRSASYASSHYSHQNPYQYQQQNQPVQQYEQDREHDAW